MTVDELCEKIWDGSFTSMTELNYELNELRQEGYTAGYSDGYTKAADDLKNLAKDMEPF